MRKAVETNPEASLAFLCPTLPLMPLHQIFTSVNDLATAVTRVLESQSHYIQVSEEQACRRGR